MPYHEHPAEFGSINCCPGCHPRFCDCQEPRPLAEPNRDPIISPNLDPEEARVEAEEQQDKSVELEFPELDGVGDLAGRIVIYNEKGRVVAIVRGQVEYTRPGLRVVKKEGAGKGVSGEDDDEEVSGEDLLEGDDKEGVF